MLPRGASVHHGALLHGPAPSAECCDSGSPNPWSRPGPLPEHADQRSTPEQGSAIQALEASQQSSPHVGSRSVVQTAEHIVLGPMLDEVDITLRRELMFQPLDLGMHPMESGATELGRSSGRGGVRPRVGTTGGYLEVELVKRAGDD